MKTINAACFVFITLAVLLVGCSQGVNPVAQDLKGLSPSTPVSLGTSHNLWGLWTFICDPVTESVAIVPMREAELHLNALAFLEPPPFQYITLESKLEFSGGILDVDIGIRNPFFGQKIYTGFDICGIIFTHGSVTGYTDPESSWPGMATLACLMRTATHVGGIRLSFRTTALSSTTRMACLANRLEKLISIAR